MGKAKPKGATAGIWEPVEDAPDLRTMVVVAMRDVPDGKMPKTALALVRRALAAGMRVWSTYAVALVPNVLRKVGDRRERVTITLETVAVRFWLGDERLRGWAVWHNGSFEQAWTRERFEGLGRRELRMSAAELGPWIDRGTMSK